MPPTDSRLRPDQRCLENGQHEMANSEKLRLEQRQRQVQLLPLKFHWTLSYNIMKNALCHCWLICSHSLINKRLIIIAGTKDAREGLETKVVCQGKRQQLLPLCWRVLGDQGKGELGILSWHFWPILNRYWF